jgi:hypothetical protein
MAQMIKDADGKEIEVFTAEEVAAREAAALELYQKDHPDQSAALAAAETAKAAAEKSLADALAAGGDTKDENIKNLRIAVKTANDNTEKVKTEMTAAIDALKAAPTKEYESELVARLGGTDKDLKEKIEIRYKELAGMPSGTKAEVRARMEAAYQLAAGKPAATILDGGVTSAGSRGDGGMPQAGTQENDNSKAMRNVLGISDEAAKKFAPKPGQPGYQG